MTLEDPLAATRSILLVDDHPFIRATMRQLLTQLDYRHIAEAGDGEEALKTLALRKIDMVFLDVEMEPMDGARCLRLVRENDDPEIATVPVVMLTTHAEEGLVRGLMKYGIHGYLVKPPSLVAVEKSLERALGLPSEAQQTA